VLEKETLWIKMLLLVLSRSAACDNESGIYRFAFEMPKQVPDKYKDRDKVVPVLFFFTKHHAMKVYRGSGGIAAAIM
jgi:hypothetical protein